MYVDDSMMSTATKRRSTTEDDHPPSPEMDPLDFMSQQHMAGSPAGARAPRLQQTDGFRFHGPMTPPSNPQTPASPSTQKLSQVDDLSVFQSTVMLFSSFLSSIFSTLG